MKLFLVLFMLVSLPLMAQSFLPGTEDVPLMPGLTQVEETASFDSPSERLVLISAQTSKSQKKVENFYRETLRNLGWLEARPNVFERGQDSLALEISVRGTITYIQFRLSERNP